MRKLIITAVTLGALVATGVAVAHGIEGAKTATAVSSTFTANATTVKSTTCTTSDGKTIVATRGTYMGPSSGSADLTGEITIQASSIVNTTDDVGTVTGQIGIANHHSRAGFAAVYDHGSIAGLATGHAKVPAGLLANISATFSPTTGFTNGKIGGGTAGGSAVEIGRSACASRSTTHEHSDALGSISAISASSITVAGLTCATPADLTPKYKTGDTVRIACTFTNGTNTLSKISAFAGAKHNARSGANH